MAFSIEVGTVSVDPRTVTKTMSGTTYTGSLRNESNVVNPSILVNASAADIATCNYMSISSFGRKYFITDIIAVSNYQCIVNGHCDVLSSYADGIKGNSCVLARSTSSGDPLINDGSIRTKTTKTYSIRRGFAKFNDYSIILVTV